MEVNLGVAESLMVIIGILFYGGIITLVFWLAISLLKAVESAAESLKKIAEKE